MSGSKLDAFPYLLCYLFLVVALTFFIGMRTEDIGSDTYAYFKYFNFVKYGESFDGAERIEIGFYWLTKIISLLTDSQHFYLAVIFLIQFLGITSAINKGHINFRPYFFIALIWLSFPFFYSITFNIVRQGVAFVFVVYAIDAKLLKKTYLPYVFLLLGGTFHYATYLYIIGFIVIDLNIKIRSIFYFWIIAAFAGLFGITERAMHSLLQWIAVYYPYWGSYLDARVNESYVTGVRLDFLIFSALPAVGYFVLRKYEFVVKDSFKFILSLYLAMNAFYFIFAWLPYNDRFALLSWLLMPLMVSFDFLNKIGMEQMFKRFIVCSSTIVLLYHLWVGSPNLMGS